MNKTSLSLIGIILSSCTVGPKYCPPKMCLPLQYQAKESVGMTTTSPDYFLWWKELKDPTLDALIQRAYCNNLDLRIAYLRIVEARLERKGKCAERLPHIDASVTGGHAYMSRDVLTNTPFNQPSTVQRNVDFYEIGFDAEWEFDLFGQTTHEINALTANVQIEHASYKDVWITLSAEIARNYVDLRIAQNRLEIMKKHVADQRETVELTETLVDRGIKDSTDLNLAREQLGQYLSTQPMLELAIIKAIHRLSILTGNTPNCLYEELKTLAPLPLIPCNKPIGVPSELLRRRPDIRRAERELAYATEKIGSAIAALFPRISLKGFIGDISTHFSSLTTSSAHTWFLSPQLLAPIFNSKMLMQDVDLNKVRTREALYNYQKTVLGALEETENAISSFHAQMQRSSYLAQAKNDGVEVSELTMDLYTRGVKDYFEVLIANTTQLNLEDAYIESQRDLLYEYISLYKALGGSFDCHN